jgi:hypothetical protein
VVVNEALTGLVVVPRNPTTGTVGCCARAANGHTAAVPTKKLINSRRLMCLPRGSGQGIVAAQTSTLEGVAVDVRFGSKADICAATSHVGFTPNSDTNRHFEAAGRC